MKLEEAELFRALPADELQACRDLLSPRAFKARDTLFFAGDAAAHLWLVQEGQVRLYKTSIDGRLTTLDTLGPGQAFGALSPIGQDEYPASADAVTAGVALRLPRAKLVSLLEAHPVLALEILGIVSARLHVAHERLRSFAHDPAPIRLARALWEATLDGEAKVTRRALAEVAGTTVETAIRVLRRFEADGIIRGRVGAVEVLDATRLRELFEDAQI